MPRKTTKRIQKVEVLSPVIADDENYSDAVKKASFLLDFDVRGKVCFLKNLYALNKTYK